MGAASDLPDELLISIFRLIVGSVDTAQVYENLISLQLVCEKWRKVAKVIMYSRVEVVRSEDAAALERTLATYAIDGRRVAINTLVVGVAESWQGLMDQVQLDRLFAQLPDVRKLVVVNVDYGPRPATMQALEHLSLLTALIDVTITTSTTLETTTITSGLIRSLPSQVRFLQFTGNPDVPPEVGVHTPTFQLYGLTIQQYPSSMAGWVLLGSRETLQCLTVDTLDDLDHLVAHHPNLRSLRVLSPADMPIQSFQSLLNLERLELRAQNAPGTILITLPKSLRYVRFWATDLAIHLEKLLSTPDWRRGLPDLQTVIWDYFPTEGGIEDETIMRLLGFCLEEAMELRTYPRGNGGTRASKGHDLAYESLLRASCFTNGEVLPAALRLPFTQIPSRVLFAFIAKHIPVSPLFSRRHPWTVCRPIFEDCFSSHSGWLRRLGQAINKRDEQWNAYRRPEPREQIRTPLQPSPINFILLSCTTVAIATTVIFFTVLRHRPGARLGVAFGAGVLLQSVRYPGAFLSRRIRRIHPTMLLYVGLLNGLYGWILAVFMLSAVIHTDGVTMGLGITGGIVLTVYGSLTLFTCFTSRN